MAKVVAFLSSVSARRSRSRGGNNDIDHSDGDNEDDDDDVLVPASFVVAGAGVGSQRSFFKHLATAVGAEGRNVVVTVSADDGLTLKLFLRQLIHRVVTTYSSAGRNGNTGNGNGNDADADFHLKYDVRALHAWATTNRVRHIVVAFEDADAFNSTLVRDIIDLFHSWADRLSVFFVFGITTSAEHFYDRLPPSAARMIDGHVVSLIRPHELIEQFLAATVDGDDFSVRLGPNVLRAVVGSHSAHSQSVQLVLDSLKVSHPLNIYTHTDTHIKSEINS